jgi:hypothetical protein
MSTAVRRQVPPSTIGPPAYPGLFLVRLSVFPHSFQSNILKYTESASPRIIACSSLITAIFHLTLSKPVTPISSGREIDHSNPGSVPTKLTVALLIFPQYFQIPIYCIKVGCDHFLPHPSLFIIHNQLTVSCYINRPNAVEKMSLNELRNRAF